MFSNPTPSPDGKKLYVIGQQRHFDLIGLDHKSPQFSIYLPGVSAGEADITTNGEWITYVAHPELTLWRSKLDGSSRTQLTYAPYAGPYTALVSGWNSDRIYGIATGKTLEDIRGTRGGRHTS